MDAKGRITKNLQQIIRSLTKENFQPEVKISPNLSNGDYYTNVALRLGSILNKKPADLAEKIAEEYKKLGDSNIAKVEAVNPGFVNFFLSEQYLKETIDYIKTKGSNFGSSDTLKNQKVMIEFTDPNPFKEFHIGHLYSNIVGESISRLYESRGATVWRVCYQGDVGLHVAKAIYGTKKLSSQMPSEIAPLSIRAQFMGRAYALGSQDYEKESSAKKEINELNKKIYEGDPSVRDLYKKGREWSLEYFDSIYKRLGTKFKRYYFESETALIGKKLIEQQLSIPPGTTGIFESSAGAIVFRAEKFGFHTRVFITKNGIPTYETKDLGLAVKKYKDFPYDLSIIITAQEQAEYFKVILAALSQINPELASKTQHISHGMVRLPGGKMSSRTGDVITGEWLIDEAISRISKSYPDMGEVTSEKVGLAAIKYALLKNTIGQDIEFNFDESISLNGASGPYLQYSYVRTHSLLEKSKKSQVTSHKSITLNSEELAVLRNLVHFPEVVLEAQIRLSPNVVAQYLFELASKFNLFYQKHRIADDSFRLRIAAAVGHVLKSGLTLLGIETVERM